VARPAPSSPRLILASASPRRRELLAAAGIAFVADPSGVDESLPAGVEPEAAAEELAERKARAVAERWRGTDRLVLGADTVVALDGPGGAVLLGKPADADEARGMLRRLSGTRHKVVTAVAVVRARDGASALAHETTHVRMRPILASEIEAYVASGEWVDKAGGYAIQESADAFVQALEGGGLDNVVGLPVALARRLIAALERP